MSTSERQPVGVTDVLLAEPQQLFGEALRTYIERNGRYRVAATAPDGPAALDSCRRVNPGIVLMRAELPGLNAADTTRRLVQILPKARVIIYASDDEAWTVNAAFEAGACACLLTSCPAEELDRALDAVSSGGGYICPRIVDRLTRARQNRAATPNGVQCPPPPDALTPKEREILQRIAEGEATKEIAWRLDISIKTVETHRTNITRKLNLHNAAQLTRYAIRHGLVTPV